MLVVTPFCFCPVITTHFSLVIILFGYHNYNTLKPCLHEHQVPNQDSNQDSNQDHNPLKNTENQTQLSL